MKSQLAGYRTFERSGLRVGTQQFLTVDVTLEVGGINESITVTGQSPLVDTSTASTGGTLDREALEVLPSPGRNAFLIGVTVPSVNPVGDPQPGHGLGAEVHMILRSHGVANAGSVATQIGSFDPTCGVCEDQQAVVFAPTF